VSLVGRLEKSLEFLKANAWGQGSDRTQYLFSREPVYCARGAVVYGAFADEVDKAWCLARAEWHEGTCTDDNSYCEGDHVVSFPEFDEVIAALDAVVGDITGLPYPMLTEYNDEAGRTKEEVIEVFERAIERAREGQA
jgi:hypothetical protein